MIIDEKGKLFGKISIVDIAAILLVFALLGGVYFKLFVYGRNMEKTNATKFNYQVMVSDVRMVSVDALQIGNKVFDEDTKEYLGIIVDKEIKPCQLNLLKNDGTYVKAEKPDRYNVIITVEATGIVNNEGYIINGKREIKRGLEQKLVTRVIAPNATVLDIIDVKG